MIADKKTLFGYTMASTWPWTCIVCKKEFPSYEDSIYLCVCSKNQLVCKECVTKDSLTYEEVSELFGRKHYVRDISNGISEAIKNVVDAQQRLTVMGRHLERRRSNGFINLSSSFFYPREGKRPSVVQRMMKDVLFRSKYVIPQFVDVITHLTVKVDHDIKLGVLLDRTLCKLIDVKRGMMTINFFAPLFLLKDRLKVRVLPKDEDVRLSMIGFVISSKSLKKALSKEKVWIPSTKISIDGKKIRFSAPNPLSK